MFVRIKNYLFKAIVGIVQYIIFKIFSIFENS